MASDREKLDKSKMNSSVKHIPKDAQVIMSILKELNVTEYEPRVINQLLEFTYRTYINIYIESVCLRPTNCQLDPFDKHCLDNFLFLFHSLHRIHHLYSGRCKNLRKSCEEKGYRFRRCEIGIADDNGESIYVAATQRSMCFVCGPIDRNRSFNTFHANDLCCRFYWNWRVAKIWLHCHW